MPSWTETDLPCPLIASYGYSVDLGQLRTPFAFSAPRQTQQYDQRPRLWTLSWRLSTAQLETAQAWLDANGYAWFDLPLLSSESVGATPTDHRVRLVGDIDVRRVAQERWSLSTQAEMAAADETCSLAANYALYTVCIDLIPWIEPGDWPGSVAIAWCDLADAWGTESDPWERLN